MSEMTVRQKQQFVERLRELNQAWLAVEREWTDGGEFCDQYPFQESFDELQMGVGHWLAACEEKVKEAKLAAMKMPATATLDITDNGVEFRVWTQARSISYRLVGECFNGWTAEFHGSRFALEDMVRRWWGEEQSKLYMNAIRNAPERFTLIMNTCELDALRPYLAEHGIHVVGQFEGSNGFPDVTYAANTREQLEQLYRERFSTGSDEDAYHLGRIEEVARA